MEILILLESAIAWNEISEYTKFEFPTGFEMRLFAQIGH
jgi:hypothetical protein